MDTETTVYLDLPASYQYLPMLSACITEMLARVPGIPEPQITAYNVQLAAHEICTNIVAHAYGERPDRRIQITLSVRQSPHCFEIELCDGGRPFDPTQVADPDLEAGQVHGYGLFLARSLLDVVEYVHGPAGNRWRLVKFFAES